MRAVFRVDFERLGDLRMSYAAPRNVQQNIRHSRLALFIAAGTLLCGCGQSNDAGSTSISDGATAPGGASASGGASTGGMATATTRTSVGGTPASGGATATGGTSTTGGATLGIGGATHYKEPTQPTQETEDGGASTDCVSPFQNAQLITSADAPRCDCESGTATCVNDIQFVCGTSWMGVSVGSCASPNACLIVGGKKYRTAELQNCMSGSGDYPCTWELRFALSLSPYFTITRGLGGRQDGKYHCDGMSIILGEGSSSTVATYDESTGTVAASGVTYVEAS